MSKLMEMIKKFLGIRAKYEMLPEGQSNKDEIVNPSKGIKGIKYSVEPTNRQIVEQAFNRRKELAEKNIELNSKEQKYDMSYLQAVLNKGKEREREKRQTGEIIYFNAYLEVILDSSLKKKVQDVVMGLYESDPSILNEDRTQELIELIKEHKVIGKYEEEIRFSEWAKNELYIPPEFGTRYGGPVILTPEIDLKSIVEQVMTLDEFISHVIESRVVGMQADLENASVIGEKFGLSFSLSKAIDLQCQLPHELEGKYENVEDYQKKVAECIQKDTEEVIEQGTFSNNMVHFMKKFADSQLFSKNAILAYKPEEYKQLINKILENDIETGDVNSEVTRFAEDWLKQYMIGLWKGVHAIPKENKENVYFENYEEEKNGGARYHFYEGVKSDTIGIEQKDGIR